MRQLVTASNQMSRGVVRSCGMGSPLFVGP